MFASLALVLSALSAPPDPLAGLRLMADGPVSVAVLHPAAVWELPLCKPLRDRFPAAKAAVAAGRKPSDNPAADMDATLAHGLADLCRTLDIDSPAEVERVALLGGAEIVALVTLRRPFDLTKLAAQLPAVVGLPPDVPDPVTCRTLSGRPYLRIDGVWTGVLLVDGGRTLIAGPPHRLERMADRAPVASRLTERVLAGDHLIYFSAHPPLASEYAKFVVGDAALDGLKSACVGVRFAGQTTTLDVWLDGCPPPANFAATLKVAGAASAKQLRGLPPAAADPFIAAFGPFRAAVADALEKVAPLPSPGGAAARVTVAALPPPLLLASFPGPMLTDAGTSAQTTPDNPTLAAVTKALLAFEAKHGTLPPAATRDAAGRPLLSWRVAILPFLGADAAKLSAEFRQGEPWDSPHNMALVTRMPAAFEGFAHKRGQPLTPYQVFAGAGTAFDGPAGIATKDFPDGKLTVLVGESGRLVPWTKPQDIRYDPTGPILGWMRSNSNQLDGRVWLGFADGTVAAVRTGTGLPQPGAPTQAESQRRLKAAVTRNGKEPLTRGDLPAGPAVRDRPFRPGDIVPAQYAPAK